MVETPANPQLVQDYEAIRKQEYSLITNLLEFLPRIDNLGVERVSQVRDAMFHADHPYLMVLVGPFNSGKTSLINALLGSQDFLKIGPVPTTDRISILRWGEEPQSMGTAGGADTAFYPSPLLRKVSLVDTPGLESVFKEHEETTRNFLHRADVVLLVMLATQAMSQSHMDMLKMFKEYGKKVILVINQADLISEEERKTVRQYVSEQSKDKLGLTPEIWMVSAKTGQEARTNGELDSAKWKESGLNQVEDYINKQLSDADLLRQKLQTPLQIVQLAHQGALATVRHNQSTFDRYRNITDNIDQQLATQKREQEKLVRETTNDIEVRFRDTSERSKDAIQDIFQLSRAFGSLVRGFYELTGLARIFRRADTPTYMEATFKRYKVFERINELPSVVDKLAPRLEGQDMHDLDALVAYGNKEVQNLPADMQSKVIGNIQAPTAYDRSFLQKIREDLEKIEDEARAVETENLEHIRRSNMLYLAVWELIMLFLGIALINQWDAVDTISELPAAFISLLFILGLALIGFAALPLRGRAIHTSYVNRLLKLQAKYTELLTRAADQQIEYGMQLRKEAILPLTRLVESQASIHDEQLSKLQNADQLINSIESELNALGKRKIFGKTF